MGNVSSVFRGNEVESADQNRRNTATTGTAPSLSSDINAHEFLSIQERNAQIELNGHDYQMTLHQYLSQRYAERYTNTQYDDYNHRQRSHEIQANQQQLLQQQQQQKGALSSSFNKSQDLILLSLKGKKLKEVPREIFDHSEITSLDLSNNEITSLPKELKKLRNLKRLALGGNQIISLPDEISTLKELTWFDFTNNRISEIPASFAALKNLTSLGASDCRLGEFPKVICQMKNMRKLGMFNNLFSTLPREIGNLNLMTKLDLSGNALTSLPEEIGNLTELTWLNLSHNQLQSIPESMTKLTKLKELGLAHNKLKKLPNLSTLRELTLLPVYNNELEELGSWIGNLSELNKLDLSCNELKTIPAEILLPPKLTFINLRKNRLKVFPDKVYDRRIDSMVQVPLPMELVTIDVRENELEYLPLALIGPALVELKTAMNPWRIKDEDLGSEINTVPIEVPSLLNMTCAQMIQTDALRPLLSSTTLPIQIHILQNTHNCQYCERPATHKGIDCMLWRATTDSGEVPFKANVCCKTCLKAIDAIPIK